MVAIGQSLKIDSKFLLKFYLKNINRMKQRIILTLQQNSHPFIVASREMSGSILNAIIRHPGTVQYTASTLSDTSHVE